MNIRSSRLAPIALVALPLAALAACGKKLDVPMDQIPQLSSLHDVMHANETIAGRQWSKVGEDSYTDPEFAELEDTGTRMEALAQRAKSFSRGPIFDKYNDQLIERSKALASAAKAKDAKTASDALGAMKQLCKDCHAETR